ncbi:MAG: hypothetical protein IPH31_08950 [Lewinellaceae bacterium]|nr:hypothetical protein [Lewinellaceae bacterium]
MKTFKPVHTMQIDIPAHIEKLLFLHDALVIPGFGGFTATRTPASTDYVGGTVNPPAKTLAFSENLTIDDGLLTADIADAHGLSTEDAGRTVEEFVEKMRNLLDQREIVTLPGIGRLYKNYVQKIQFLPDATNFNASSYGLPPLQFSPIARSREVTETLQASPSTAESNTTISTGSQAYTPATPPPPMPEPTYAPERSGGSSNVGTALGVFLLLAALSAGIWYWQHRKKAAEEAKKADTEIVTTDTHKEAEKSIEETPTIEENAASDDEALDKAAKESLEEKEKSAREKVNIARNGRECILIIASLSDKNNSDKLRKLLTEENYEEYYQQNGKTHVVGVRFLYLKPAEIEEKKKALMALTGVNFIVVRKK